VEREEHETPDPVARSTERARFRFLFSFPRLARRRSGSPAAMSCSMKWTTPLFPFSLFISGRGTDLDSLARGNDRRSFSFPFPGPREKLSRTPRRETTGCPSPLPPSSFPLTQKKNRQRRRPFSAAPDSEIERVFFSPLSFFPSSQPGPTAAEGDLRISCWTGILLGRVPSFPLFFPARKIYRTEGRSWCGK